MRTETTNGVVAFAAGDDRLHLDGNRDVPDPDMEIDLAAADANVPADEASPAPHEEAGGEVLTETGDPVAAARPFVPGKRRRHRHGSPFSRRDPTHREM
jgi:hypothetical protein